MNATLARRIGIAAAAVALVVAVIIGIGDASESSETPAGDPDSAGTEADFERALEGAPHKLASVYAHGDALLDGGVGALERQIDDLDGFPAVVNAWGSWCNPCRAEFPIFQTEAMRRGKQVAFLGVDVEDSPDAANTFLDQLPLPYPSFVDQQGEIRSHWHTLGLPATAFYDSSGKLVHLRDGPYRTVAELDADVDRYAK